MEIAKISIFTIFIFALLLTTAKAITPYNYTNMANYVLYNITSNTFKTQTIIGNTILTLPVAYTYIPFNTTLSAIPFQYIAFAGLNSTGNFIGNITAYPYENGAIVANTTQNGKPYTYIALYYKQFILQPTYLNKTLQQIKEYSDIDVDNYEALITYNITLAQKPILTITGNGANTKHYLSFYFNDFKIPYLLYANSTALNTLINATLFWYPSTPTSIKATEIIANNTKASINSLNTYYKNSVSVFANNALSLYMSPLTASTAYMVLNNGAYQANNYTIANSSLILPSARGVFFSLYNFNLNLYAPNDTTLVNYLNPPMKYVLLPAFSTNAVVFVSANTITNPRLLNTSQSTSAVDSGNGWHHYFAYRESINITNWNYTFTSYYDNGYHNLTFKNLKYAVITIPYYFQMGNWSSGWQIGIEGYNPSSNLDLGSVPFAVLSNTTSTITLVLLNKTNESYTYNFAYIEWGNKYAGTGLQVVNTGYNNQSIKKIYMPFNFSAGSTLKTFYISNYVNTTTNSSIFVNFTNPLNSQSCIYIWSGPLTYQYAYGVGFAYYYIRDWQVIPLLDGVTYYNPYWATDKTFYVVDNARSSPTYIQSAHGLAEGPETYGGPEYAYIANATQEYQETINYNETTYAYINITYNSGYLYRPATHSFTLNSTIQYYQSSTSSSSTPIKHTPQPIGSPFSINITNATLNTSNIATIVKNNGLNQSITLMGVKTNSLVFLFLDIIFIILIFAFGSHEGIAIFGLIGLWLMGILPMSITNLILASLITLLYIASKIPSWLNGDK